MALCLSCCSSFLSCSSQKDCCFFCLCWNLCRQQQLLRCGCFSSKWLFSDRFFVFDGAGYMGAITVFWIALLINSCIHNLQLGYHVTHHRSLLDTVTSTQCTMVTLFCLLLQEERNDGKTHAKNRLSVLSCACHCPP